MQAPPRRGLTLNAVSAGSGFLTQPHRPAFPECRTFAHPSSGGWTFQSRVHRLGFQRDPLPGLRTAGHLPAMSSRGLSSVCTHGQRESELSGASSHEGTNARVGPHPHDPIKP